ncbi:Aste57867_20757 [Aphanomyces stellatus]|uniref:Aste57867_20757 protein n=1 Tax=Aphanomyces stellatus TaxID=120398 RepID=A0A485LH68_9STRA|nr:hypothetical protein As57867_020689 [Aphanomyces stellatus]VFT97436.1 Aste57867_20757 [Aphanomyces stellatus]
MPTTTGDPFVDLVTLHENELQPIVRLRHQVDTWFRRYSDTASSRDDADDVTRSKSRARQHPWLARAHLWQLASLEFSPLHETCRVGDTNTLDVILRAKTSCTLHKTSAGHTPLHVAVIHGHVACIQRLLQEDDAPLQLLARDHGGRTPLHLAFDRHTWRDTCVPVLMQHATPFLCSAVRDVAGRVIRDLDLHFHGGLFDAAADGNVLRMQFLHQMYGFDWREPLRELQRTLLHEGCQHLQGNVVTYLLTQCTPAWLLTQDSSGATALHVCAKRGFLEGCVLVLDAPETATSLLLMQDTTGRTALHWSLLHRHDPTSTFLLECAAMHASVFELLGTCDDDGASPLHVAAAINHVVMAEKLLDLGADFNLAAAQLRPRSHRLPQWRPKSTAIGAKDISKMLATRPVMECQRANRLQEAVESTTLAQISQHTVELKTLQLLVPAAAIPTLERQVSPLRLSLVPIPTPLELALRGHCKATSNLLLQYGADFTLVPNVWRVYLTAPSLRPLLAPFARLWLDPTKFPVDAFAAICQTYPEAPLCSLLSLGFDCLDRPFPWTNLAHAAFYAFQSERHELAGLLLKAGGHRGAPWPRPPSPHVSWLCAAACRGSLSSVQWLQDQQYEPSEAADAVVFECVLQPLPRIKDSVAHTRAIDQRTRLFEWLWASQVFHQSTLPLHGQRIFDIALRHGYIHVARLLSSNVQSMNAADAILHDHTFLLQAATTLPPKWTNGDIALTLACQRNLVSMGLLRVLIQHNARPAPHACVYGKSAIVWAAHHGRIDVLRVLAKLDPSCLLHRANQKRGRSFTTTHLTCMNPTVADALYEAARSNHVAAVEFLWSCCVGQLNVAAAVISAVEANALDALKWMVERDPEIRTTRTTGGESLVHIACARGHLELAEWLEPRAMWTSVQNTNGLTVLQLVRLFGHPLTEPFEPLEHDAPLHGLVRNLLDDAKPWRLRHRPPRWRWARKHESSTFDCTCVHAACTWNSVLHVHVLAALGASLVAASSDSTDNPTTPLYCAARHGATDVVEYLLVQGIRDDDASSALRIAAKHGHTTTVHSLLTVHPPPSSLGRLRGDGPHVTLLHHLASLPDAKAAVALLLDAYHDDVDLDVLDGQGFTPVVHALVSGRLTTVLILLQRGARVEAEYEGQSVFYYALHLLPSDCWRLFFQGSYTVSLIASSRWTAFLRGVVGGRGLHCTAADRTCGCKSFEGKEDVRKHCTKMLTGSSQQTCSFCNHPFESHSDIPLPPWHNDVNDTYRLLPPSPSGSSRGGEKDAFFRRDDASSDDNDATSHRSDEEDDCADKPNLDTQADDGYIGRLSQAHVHMVTQLRFEPHIQHFALALTPPPPFISDVADDDTLVTLQPPASNEAAEDTNEQPTPSLSTPPMSSATDGEDTFVMTSSRRTDASSMHLFCWCSHSDFCVDTDSKLLRRAVVRWLAAAASPSSTAISWTSAVGGIAEAFARWRRQAAAALWPTVPRDANALVRLKLFTLHWRHAKVLQAFCRWKHDRRDLSAWLTRTGGGGSTCIANERSHRVVQSKTGLRLGTSAIIKVVEVAVSECRVEQVSVEMPPPIGQKRDLSAI